MRSADRSSPRSIPARSGDSLCAASIKLIACARSFRQNSRSAAMCCHTIISPFPPKCINASEISSALNRDLLKRFSRRANPCRARVARTKESTLSSATLAASDSLSPSGSSTIPPAMVCRSEESRTTKRSPMNAKMGEASFKRAIFSLPASRDPFSRNLILAATRDAPWCTYIDDPFFRGCATVLSPFGHDGFSTRTIRVEDGAP